MKKKGFFSSSLFENEIGQCQGNITSLGCENCLLKIYNTFWFAKLLKIFENVNIAAVSASPGDLTSFIPTILAAWKGSFSSEIVMVKSER